MTFTSFLILSFHLLLPLRDHSLSDVISLTRLGEDWPLFWLFRGCSSSFHLFPLTLTSFVVESNCNRNRCGVNYILCTSSLHCQFRVRVHFSPSPIFLNFKGSKSTCTTSFTWSAEQPSTIWCKYSPYGCCLILIIVPACSNKVFKCLNISIFIYFELLFFVLSCSNPPMLDFETTALLRGCLDNNNLNGNTLVNLICFVILQIRRSLTYSMVFTIELKNIAYKLGTFIC